GMRTRRGCRGTRSPDYRWRRCGRGNGTRRHRCGDVRKRRRTRGYERRRGGDGASTFSPRRPRTDQRVARRRDRSGCGSPEGGVRLMLYYLHNLSGYWPVLNVTRYITFRTAGASLTALVIGLFVGPWMIRKLREFQIGQVIRQEGPATPRPRAATPARPSVLVL